MVVAIELKIEASEHSGQLGRYRKIVETDWPSGDWRHVLLFLTKRGDYPSIEDGKGWNPLPLESLLPALDAVLARGEGTPDARVMLAAYLAMLRRRHLTDQRLEELAASLWAKHREALEFLADRRPDAYSEIFELLTQQSGSIAKQISEESGLEVVPDHHRPAAIQFAVPAWDKIDGFRSADGFTASGRLILVEIVRASKTPNTLRCYIMLGKGDQEMRQRLFQSLQDDGAIEGKKLTKDWNRLASKSIKLGDIEDDPDIAAAVAKKVPEIVEFVANVLPRFDQALSPMVP